MTKLLETLLKSEFKFGFELEAYVSSNSLNTYLLYEPYYDDENYDEDTFDGYQYDNDEPYYEDEINEDALYSDLSKYFSQYFGQDLEVVSDGSLDSKRGGFELPSPVMNLTPLNIKKCINFLYNLNASAWEIYTDETCGFHTHISFPQMTNEDMVWILCHLSLDSNFKNELLSFKTTAGEEFNFFSRWASTDYLQEIESAIRQENWSELSKWLSNEKYRLIRIHPQGTLEWRGPRNFLNKNNLQTIKEFFIKLLKVVSFIIKIMDKKEINGITKENFFNLIDISNLETQKIQSNTIKSSIYEAIIDKPLILTKISNKHNVSWRKFIKHLYNMVADKHIKFEDFLIPLRYKKFNNEQILTNIILNEPNFIYYTANPLDEILKYMDSNQKRYFLCDKNLNSELLYNILKTPTIYLIDILNSIERRLDSKKSVSVFFDKTILKALKKYKVHNKNNMELIKSFSAEYPIHESYYLKLYNLMS